MTVAPASMRASSTWAQLSQNLRVIAPEARSAGILETLHRCAKRTDLHPVTRTVARALTLGLPAIPKAGKWLLAVLGPPVITVVLLLVLTIFFDSYATVAALGGAIGLFACLLVVLLYVLAFPRSLKSADAVEGWAGAELMFWALTIVGTVTFAFAVGSVVVAGVDGSTADSTPWMAFGHYLWHVADAVPSLGITDALDWTKPDAFAGNAAGVAVVAYKIVLVVPLFRLAAGILQTRLRAPAAE